jgi:hypothetical protein
MSDIVALLRIAYTHQLGIAVAVNSVGYSSAFLMQWMAPTIGIAMCQIAISPQVPLMSVFGYQCA